MIAVLSRRAADDAEEISLVVWSALAGINGAQTVLTRRPAIMLKEAVMFEVKDVYSKPAVGFDPAI